MRRLLESWGDVAAWTTELQWRCREVAESGSVLVVETVRCTSGLDGMGDNKGKVRIKNGL